MTDEKRCETCRFWEVRDPDKKYKEGGCHRHAPVSTYADTEIHDIKKTVLILLWWYVREHDGDPDKQLSDQMLDIDDGWRCTCWPRTSEDDWCGEWELKNSG